MSNQASATPATTYAALQTAQPEIADYDIGKPAAFKHGKYQIKIAFASESITVSVVTGNNDTVVENQTKTVSLPGVTEAGTPPAGE